MYSNIDKKTAEKIIKEIKDVLSKYGAEVGLELDTGRAKYSNSDVSINVTMKIAGQKSFSEERADSNTKAYLAIYKLTSEPRNGKQIVRFDTRKHKFPVIYKNLADNKLYKTSVEHAKMIFAA